MSPFSFLFLCLIPLTFSQVLQVSETEGPPHLQNGKPNLNPLQHFQTVVTPQYKLNDTVSPMKYVLSFDLDIDAEIPTATGVEVITLSPNAPRDNITIHANPDFLTLNETSLRIVNTNQTSQVITITSVDKSGDDRHFVLLNLDTTIIPENVYELHTEFVSYISTDATLSGLYLSTYVDSNKVTKRAISTQFQPYHARQLFPSFDEPLHRSIFEVTLTHLTNYTTVLGNGALLRSEPVIGDTTRTRTIFTPTEPMATYLVAILVSDFQCQHDNTTFKVPVGTCAPPPIVERGGTAYPTEIAPKLLKFFDTYYDTSYAFGKMDSVSIPQFPSGAMENWGLNMYRENYLIYYPGETLESNKNLLTSVISHELAHQNFGNLVTCQWWSELWLNEGFATFVSYLGVDAVAPEFRHREFILNDAFQVSMRVDVSATSHPIQNDGLSPGEVDSYFTGITYEKAGSINRMTEAFLTEPTYQKGLRYYLREMGGQAVTAEDLFRNLDKAAAEDGGLPDDLTVDTILKTWTLQKSHPLLRVGKGPAANKVTITQERYADREDVELWIVPVTIATQSASQLPNLKPKLWLRDAIDTVDHKDGEWILLNYNSTGYFRVLYDEELTGLIETELDKGTTGAIPPLSRSQLIDDYFTLAQRGMIPVERALSLTKYLANEDHFAVWEPVFFHLRRLFNLLPEDFVGPFSAYLLPRLNPALASLGLEASNNLNGMDRIFHSKLLDWACALGDSACEHYSHDLHGDWNETYNPVPLDIHGSIACAIVASGDQSSFTFILDKYQNESTDHAAKLRLLNALACSKNETTLQYLLDSTLTGLQTPIEESHKLPIIQRVAINKKGKRMVISFLEKEFQRILTLIGNGNLSVINSIVQSLSGVVMQNEEIEMLLNIITSRKLMETEIGGRLHNSLNVMRGNEEFWGGQGSRMIEWMRREAGVENGASKRESVLLSVGIAVSVMLIKFL